MKPLQPEGPVWVDGRLASAAEATVGLTQPDIQAGLGVFETIAVRAGAPIDLSAHLERLTDSAAHLSVSLPERALLDGAARDIAARVDGGFGWLKISAVRSGRCVVWGGQMDPADEGRPATAVLLPWRRSVKEATAGAKSLNYASQTLGIEEARRRGADEGIWLNTRGHLAEGCMSNLFVVRHRTLYTASVADGVLPGITRGVVLRAAAELGLIVHEGKARVRRLLFADEAFLSSSLRGIRPLVTVDGKPVGHGPIPGPVTRAVSARVAALRGISSGAGAPAAQGDPHRAG